MSITTQFYTFRKKVNSTAKPSGAGVEMECVLKESCSLTSPTLIVSTGSNVAPSWNYCYIEDFSRFYFINEWTWSNGLWRATLRRDALASNKEGIGDSTQYVLRSASNYDGSIVDSMYPVTTQKHLEWLDIFSSEHPNPFVNTENGQFLLGVQGYATGIGVNNFGATTYYVLSPAQMKDLLNWLFSEGFIQDFSRWVAKPFDFITSLKYYPFKIVEQTADNLKTGIIFGNIINTSLHYYKFDGTVKRSVFSSGNITLPRHPQEARGIYLNSSPFTDYTLAFAPFGIINIDTSKLLNDGEFSNDLRLDVNLDIITGEATLEIITGRTVSDVIDVRYAKLGFDLSISAKESTVDATLGFVNALGNAGIASLVGNVPGTITGTASAISSALQFMQPPVSVKGTNTGTPTIWQDNFWLRSEFRYIADENLAHKGRPLCQEKEIKTLEGFVLCSDAELDLPITEGELQEIKNYMEGGFFYE